MQARSNAMTDPFELLRAPTDPIAPDPAFATNLRLRLARALNLSKGVTVSNVALDERQPSTTARAVITPYLAVSGAQAALDWYAEAFDARLRGSPIVMGDGTIGHAELDIAGAPIMLSEEHPSIGVTAPAQGDGVPVTIVLDVDDVDRVIGRAVAAGATLDRPPADYEYGRNGVVRDPFGHRWLISAQPTVSGLRHGEIGYVSLWVPDADRAAAFFSSVLDWRYMPRRGTQGHQVEGHHLHHGVWGGVEIPTLFCCFAVEDVNSATARIREAGGTAGTPREEPYGLIAECTDAAGSRFAVFEPPGGCVRGPRTVEQPTNGDLVYVTMEVAGSAQTRAFYGAVLGWQYAPGAVADGWQVEAVSPMVGLAGGKETATNIPMYRVDDIRDAVRRVRAFGGTATEPETQPYGTTSTCADDQGTRFYLGQL
jgi:uncharacterized glyoxalase superfamily protein PhnB